MNESLTSLCERFVESTDSIYKVKGFKLTSTKMMPICAYTYATSGKQIDSDQLQKCLKLVEASGGVFSGLRDANQAAVACTLAVSDDAEGTINTAAANLANLEKTYKESKYLGVAALLIPKMDVPEEFDSKVAKGKVIYDCLKTRHKINTDYHDTLLTNLVAYSEKPVEAITDEVEKIYTELKHLTNGEYAQTCALLLTCSDKPAEEKAARVKALYEAMQADKKHKYSNGAEIVVLAALSLLDTDAETLTGDILEVSELLATKKHYKGLISTYGKSERMMHAAMLVMADNMTAELRVPATAAIYLSCLYLYDIEQSEATTAAVIPLMT